MSEVPESWTQCEIGEVAEVVGGRTPSSRDPTNFTSEGGIPWITPADLSSCKKIYISRGARNLSEKGLRACSASKLPAGTVLFSSRAPIGYVAVAANELTTNQGFKSFVLSDGLDSRFVYFYLRHIKPVAEAMATGTTFKELSGATAARLPLLVAPTNEQTRIADKLDALLARVDACRERLDRVSVILNRFRQAVLATAMSGRLTEGWREEHPEQTNGRIVADKLQAAHAVAGGHRAGNAAPPTEDVHDLTVDMFPKNWQMLELRELVRPDRPITYGILKPGPDLKTGVPYIRVADYPEDRLNMSAIRRTSPDIDKAFSRSRLEAGDILLSIRGTVGHLIMIPPDLDSANITQDSARLSLQQEMNRNYVLWYLRSDMAQKRMRRSERGVAVRGINIGDVRALQIPIPSFEEQAEIVRRVEAFMAYTDRLEAHYRAARSQIERLTPSLLAKAFQGELVPQDPDDEPASALLERIRALRAKTVVSTKSPRRRATMERQTTTKEIPAGAVGIAYALREAGRELSGNALFAAAGYPSDADAEQVEAFFVAVRDILEAKQITRERRDNMDWFSLAPQSEPTVP